MTPPKLTNLPKGDIIFFDSRGDAVEGYSAQRMREIESARDAQWEAMLKQEQLKEAEK